MPDFIVTQKEKEFKILQLTDTQIIDATQARYAGRLRAEEIERWQPENMQTELFDDMDKLVAENRPDLILVTGDIVYGEFDDKGTSLKAFIEKMESYQIPWAPVWGNHDNETVLGVDWQCKQLIAAKYCLFEKGNTVGCCNYIVGIKNAEGELVRLVYMLDTNGCYNASEASLKDGVRRAVGVVPQQLEWMRSSYAEICKEYEKEVPCFVAFHIEVLDHLELMERKGYYNSKNFEKYDIGDGGQDFGDIHETFNAGEEPISVLPTFKELRVDGAFFGHSHVNNASVFEDGIRWTWGLKTGKYDYHETEKLGGTLITLSKDGKEFVVVHKQTSKTE
ncbi:MAG: hypothetical protein E7380_06975 [Clostridiales bacterium]|nr:hypothetical protein [Clostridiales bacterium]